MCGNDGMIKTILMVSVAYGLHQRMENYGNTSVICSVKANRELPGTHKNPTHKNKATHVGIGMSLAPSPPSPFLWVICSPPRVVYDIAIPTLPSWRMTLSGNPHISCENIRTAVPNPLLKSLMVHGCIGVI